MADHIEDRGGALIATRGDKQHRVVTRDRAPLGWSRRGTLRVRYARGL